MKRYGNIYEKICTLDNAVLAHKNARKDKLFYDEVKKIDNDLDNDILKNIVEKLKNKEYYLCEKDYVVFERFDKTKTREIWKLSYEPHRIVQWMIINQTKDIFINSYSHFSCASIPKRGIYYAQKFCKKYIKEYDYYLKIDIKKYFSNINQNILIEKLKKKFKDKDLIELLTIIIKSTPKGLPIGSLLSQYLSNFYLNDLDGFLENKKDIKFIRYMDDYVIFANDKKTLHEILDVIEFICLTLDLSIKENWCIRPIVNGIDFVGYVHFRDYIRLRQSTKNTMVKKCNKIKNNMRNRNELTYSEWCCINSYKGWLKYGNCYNLYKKHIKPLERYCNQYYINNIRAKSV